MDSSRVRSYLRTDSSWFYVLESEVLREGLIGVVCKVSAAWALFSRCVILGGDLFRRGVSLVYSLVFFSGLVVLFALELCAVG